MNDLVAPTSFMVWMVKRLAKTFRRTMKLVGATRSFIRAPFLVQSAFQGVFAAFIAIIALIAVLYFMRSGFEQLFEIFRLDLLLAVMGIVIVSGLAICLLSTWFVVNKLVSLKKDELYY